ncbi:MAG: cupin domain-containing protein, partial [Phycisphaerales bacterium]|nr:cupin domain-containing protein [Phycisphaerales bacterium]
MRWLQYRQLPGTWARRNVRTWNVEKTHLDPSDTAPVDMDGVDGVSMRILLGREHGMENFSMRHFVVEPGGHTPRHQHPYEHQVIVLAGEGEAEHDGSTMSIAPGEVLHVEPDKVHQFRNTGT